MAETSWHNNTEEEVKEEISKRIREAMEYADASLSKGDYDHITKSVTDEMYNLFTEWTE